MKFNFEKNAGITLIALVVTIIVLLILAGVSINMITGQNGILNRSIEAKKQTDMKKDEEEKVLSSMEELIYENVNENNIEQVNDDAPGELEKESNDVFIISSIEDLVFFSYDVRNGNTYEGKTVRLKQSLDFNSSKSYVNYSRTDYGKYGYDGELKKLLTSGEGFIPIGILYEKADITDKAGSFAGTFDGNNCIINNCYMYKKTEESYRISFLGQYLYGEVKNLGLTNIKYELISKDLEGSVSGIATRSLESSKILNCFVTGEIKQSSLGKGNVNCSGISTYSTGTIDGCYNGANIYGEMMDPTLTGYCLLGGIVINQQKNGISNCYNKGNLSASGITKDFQIGGIARLIASENTFVNSSANMGNITVDSKNAKYSKTGGIIGYTHGETFELKNLYNCGKISVNGTVSLKVNSGGIIGWDMMPEGKTLILSNCYNSGDTNINAISDVKNIGNIYGEKAKKTIIKNCYYLTGNVYDGVGYDYDEESNNDITAITDNQKQELVKKLNKDENNIWKSDTNNINNGYPILFWQ